MRFSCLGFWENCVWNFLLRWKEIMSWGKTPLIGVCRGGHHARWKYEFSRTRLSRMLPQSDVWFILFLSVHRFVTFKYPPIQKPSKFHRQNLCDRNQNNASAVQMDLQKSRSKGWSHRCHFIKEIKNSDWGSLVQQQLKFTPQTQTNILSFTFKPLLVYLCKWGPCSRRCNKSTTVYMMSFDTIRSHSNYEGMTLLVTTWTNVFRDQRQPDSSNWVMASHPPSLLLMNEGLCRLLHADDRWPVCYRPPVERKKKEENETVFFVSSWPENRPNGFQCSAIRGRTPAVFLHSCDSSNETLIWLTHPSWCHGGGHRNYTPPERELYKNPHTHTHPHPQKKKKKQEHTLKRSL